ncbi:MAG: hypothetical protein SFX18_05305 [Pirellulales bacterium]|nr:hypothetical protein [Pirellulales bacterium]
MRQTFFCVSLAVCLASLFCLGGVYSQESPPAASSPDTPGATSNPGGTAAGLVPSDHDSGISMNDDALPAANAQVKAAREFWRELDIDDSLLRRVEQNTAIQDQEYEVLLKFLRFLPKIPSGRLRELTQAVPGWQAFQSQPQTWQGGSFLLEGRLRGYVNLSPGTKFPLSEDQSRPADPAQAPNPRLRDWDYLTQLAQRGDLEGIYLSELSVPEKGARIFVFTRQAPQAWNALVPLEDLVRTRGTFLKADGGDLYFVAANLAWLPPTDLGKLGFDHGLWDSVKPNADLHLAENDAFYALLAVAQSAPLSSALPADANRDLVQLLESPADQRGKPQVLTGVVDWVIRQPINDPERVAELGFDHYYQLGISQMLPREVELKIAVSEPAAQAGEPPQIRFEKQKLGTLQFIFNARELPRGLTPEKLRQQSVRVAGYFYKNIPFRSELQVHNNRRVMLYSPCLFGRMPEPLQDFQAGKRDDAAQGWIILGVLAAGIILAAVLYAQSRAAGGSPVPSTPVKIELPPPAEQ